jgi:hypothetical protein
MANVSFIKRKFYDLYSWVCGLRNGYLFYGLGVIHSAQVAFALFFPLLQFFIFSFPSWQFLLVLVRSQLRTATGIRASFAENRSVGLFPPV